MKKPVIVIYDASALIDLVNGGLLGAWARIGIHTCVTDFGLFELKRNHQSTAVEVLVAAGCLEVVTISADNSASIMAEIQELANRHGISPADASSYRLALHRKGLLVTGDKRLRSVALKDKVEVRGILWVLDTLTSHEHISAKEAVDALNAIISSGAWLPTDECEQRRRKWSE
ncbi:MAG TPA: PIN domain-containing protein [Kiritimatiellia bacterium]|nr:PIN domain-containing protein [Kiritimatiellia bacterium]HMO99360.1 PIN domain-containing protein [Kiritimatiellia bacterium]HMP95653.1 PIN domain-containing protein [Kiritimatiellia bacterium]